MITKYEFHYKTEKSLSDLVKALNEKGIKCVLKLKEEGAELNLMYNDMYIKAKIKLYKEYEGKYTYELSVYNKDDFAKLVDFFESMK